MTDFVKWVPEFDGHKPPHWREGMEWRYTHCEADGGGDPRWNVGLHYSVPREAVYGPTEKSLSVPDYAANALVKLNLSRVSLSDLKQALSKHSAEELAKHGITLAPELDWATELWADALEARGYGTTAWNVRSDYELDEGDKAAIEIIRSRAVPKEASDA